MGSQPDIQMRQIACQELLTRDGVYSGWLRGKTTLHNWGEAMDKKINRPGFAKPFTCMISWQRRYVVVIDGYLHIYKSETSKRPEKVIDLCGFQKVERDENLKIKDVPWPFKVSSESSKRVMNYGAMSEPEMKKWTEAVKKGIEEAKQSGRKPQIYENKENILERTRRLQRQLPAVPSLSHDDSDSSDDPEDIYDYVHEMIEENKQNSSFRDSEGEIKEAEVEKPTIPRRDLALPQPHVQSPKFAKCNPTIMKPTVPLKKPSPTELTTSKPSIPPRQNSLTKSATAKPVLPLRSSLPESPVALKTNSDSYINKRPLPKEPNPGSSQLDDEFVYENPLENDLVGEATWTGPLEEGIEIMKSVTEDGIFMIRESSTGNGEETLQVKSDGAVRKYKITKEGDKLRIAGGSTFNSMAELLSFYQKNSIPNHSTKLTRPYSKV